MGWACENENALLKILQLGTYEKEESISEPYLGLRNGLFLAVCEQGTYRY